MAIDSALLRQLRLREQENLSRAALQKKQRLQIEAEIAEMQQETRQNRAETEKLRAESTKLLFKLCEHLATNSKTSDQLTAASH
jgi:seryl-tRNA synthetase